MWSWVSNLADYRPSPPKAGHGRTAEKMARLNSDIDRDLMWINEASQPQQKELRKNMWRFALFLSIPIHTFPFQLYLRAVVINKGLRSELIPILRPRQVCFFNRSFCSIVMVAVLSIYRGASFLPESVCSIASLCGLLASVSLPNIDGFSESKSLLKIHTMKLYVENPRIISAQFNMICSINCYSKDLLRA